MDQATYSLILEALYNCKCTWVMDILHHKPVNCLLVLAVDACCLNELRLDAVDRVRMVIGIKMNCECIDHVGHVVSFVNVRWETFVNRLHELLARIPMMSISVLLASRLIINTRTPTVPGASTKCN
jgi:hypothetical protein